MMTAAWLGQGTVFLLVRRGRIAWILGGTLIAVSVLSFVLLVLAPVDFSPGYDISQPASTQYKQILERNTAIVLMTVLLNIYGTVTLVGGALYSAWLFWRKRVLLHRTIGNILIASGALLPAFGGALSRRGVPNALYISELLGAILLLIGFLRAITPIKDDQGEKAAPADQEKAA